MERGGDFRRPAIDGFAQQRALGQGESYTTTQTVALAPSVSGGYLVVETDVLYPNGGEVREVDETNNVRSSVSVVDNRPSDLRVTSVVTEPENYSGEETLVSWTVQNFGAEVWAGTRGWIDNIYVSTDPEFIPARATQIGSVVHVNTTPLGAGQSYTASARLRLPPGTDGPYYVYVITDAAHTPMGNLAPYFGENSGRAQEESLVGQHMTNARARDYLYASSAFEGERRDNNIGRIRIAPGFFATMEMQLLRGRDFDDRDNVLNAPKVAVINEAAVRRYFPNEDPLGKRFGASRTVMLNGTSPTNVLVRILDDNVVDSSPHIIPITHAITATADAVSYPINSLTPVVNVNVTENDSLLLSELKVNPPGPEDAPYEFIELRGAPNSTLTNVYLLAIEGENNLNPGAINAAMNLSGAPASQIVA